MKALVLILLMRQAIPNPASAQESRTNILYMLHKKREMPKWPCTMPKRANKSNNYCHYHRDKGHDTEACIELRKMLAKMIAKGKPKEFLNHDYSLRRDSLTGRKRETNQDNDAESSRRLCAQQQRDRVPLVVGRIYVIIQCENAAAKHRYMRQIYHIEHTTDCLIQCCNDTSVHVSHSNPLVISLYFRIGPRHSLC